MTSADLIGFIASTCVACASSLLAQEAVTITAVPGNPWSYNSELIFKQGTKEIARQHTDIWGNITPVSGTIPDGLIKGHYPDGKLMMEIPFERNHAEGVGHSFDEGTLAGEMVSGPRASMALERNTNTATISWIRFMQINIGPKNQGRPHLRSGRVTGIRN